MKYLIRFFFRTIRLILGPILLFIEWLSAPKGIQRTDEEQQRVDQETEKLALYQFKTCPFCIKTRQAIKRLSLNIKLYDAQKDPIFRHELEQGGGKIKVPCLKITKGDSDTQWLYESDDIIQYLEQQFAEKSIGNPRLLIYFIMYMTLCAVGAGDFVLSGKPLKLS